MKGYTLFHVYFLIYAHTFMLFTNVDFSGLFLGHLFIHSFIHSFIKRGRAVVHDYFLHSFRSS